MKDFLSVLRASPLFSGISESELTSMLSCLEPRKEDFPKEAFVLRAGETAESIGIVLCGSVLIIQEDIWGNRNILSKAGLGQTFAAAFACAQGSVLNVNVIAEASATVMFFNVKRILNICPSACNHHNRIIRNLLSELAEKNLRFSEKLTHMGQRTTRAKSCHTFPRKLGGSGDMNLTFPFRVSSLRIISESSAADCHSSSEKCAARG